MDSNFMNNKILSFDIFKLPKNRNNGKLPDYAQRILEDLQISLKKIRDETLGKRQSRNENVSKILADLESSLNAILMKNLLAFKSKTNSQKLIKLGGLYEFASRNNFTLKKYLNSFYLTSRVYKGILKNHSMMHDLQFRLLNVRRKVILETYKNESRKGKLHHLRSSKAVKTVANLPKRLKYIVKKCNKEIMKCMTKDGGYTAKQMLELRQLVGDDKELSMEVICQSMEESLIDYYGRMQPDHDKTQGYITSLMEISEAQNKHGEHVLLNYCDQEMAMEYLCLDSEDVRQDFTIWEGIARVSDGQTVAAPHDVVKSEANRTIHISLGEDVVSEPVPSVLKTENVPNQNIKDNNEENEEIDFEEFQLVDTWEEGRNVDVDNNVGTVVATTNTKIDSEGQNQRRTRRRTRFGPVSEEFITEQMQQGNLGFTSTFVDEDDRECAEKEMSGGNKEKIDAVGETGSAAVIGEKVKVALAGNTVKVAVIGETVKAAFSGDTVKREMFDVVANVDDDVQTNVDIDSNKKTDMESDTQMEINKDEEFDTSMTKDHDVQIEKNQEPVRTSPIITKQESDHDSKTVASKKVKRSPYKIKEKLITAPAPKIQTRGELCKAMLTQFHNTLRSVIAVPRISNKEWPAMVSKITESWRVVDSGSLGYKSLLAESAAKEAYNAVETRISVLSREVCHSDESDTPQAYSTTGTTGNDRFIATPRAYSSKQDQSPSPTLIDETIEASLARRSVPLLMSRPVTSDAACISTKSATSPDISQTAIKRDVEMTEAATVSEKTSTLDTEIPLPPDPAKSDSEGMLSSSESSSSEVEEKSQDTRTVVVVNKSPSKVQWLATDKAHVVPLPPPAATFLDGSPEHTQTWTDRKVFVVDAHDTRDTVAPLVKKYLQENGANVFDAGNYKQAGKGLHVLVHNEWRFPDANVTVPLSTPVGLLFLKNNSGVHFLSYSDLDSVASFQCSTVFPHSRTCVFLDHQALANTHPDNVRNMLDFMISERESSDRIWCLKIVPEVYKDFLHRLSMSGADESELSRLRTIESMLVDEYAGRYSDSEQSLSLVEIVGHGNSHYLHHDTDSDSSSTVTTPALSTQHHQVLAQQHFLQRKFRHFCILTHSLNTTELDIRYLSTYGIAVLPLRTFLANKIKKYVE